MITRFPTRRHGPILRRAIAAFEFYERYSVTALGIVLVVAGLVLLFWTSVSNALSAN